jgi:thimet oligopeptidase
VAQRPQGTFLETLAVAGSAEEFRARSTEALVNARRLLDDVLEVQGERTLENTLVPFNDLSMWIGPLWNAIALLRSVHPDAVIRTAAEESEKDVASFANSLGLNPELCDAISRCDPDRLDPLAQRFRKIVVRDFHRAGVDRDEPTRGRVRKLREELVAIGQAFLRNIVCDVRSIELAGPAELEGLPLDYIRAHPPGPSGKVRITTDYPDYNPFMTYARSGPRRQELYVEFRRRAFPVNVEVLGKLIAKRHELATVLGYPTWAAYATEDKMIKSPEAVGRFIEEVSSIAEAQAHAEYDELLAQKRKSEPGAERVHDWEKTYLEDMVRSEKYRVDTKEIRSYFEFGRVKDGILALVHDLFGVQFILDPRAVRWHPHVEVYDVIEGGARVGRVYLDMHPREGKYKHAAMFPLIRGVGRKSIPEAALVCNFPNPRSTPGPALLEHDEVLTLFHEFGHLLHQLFAREQPWQKFAGASTEWDFIEVPSQLLEEWAWDYEVLRRFAVHHVTGDTIPRELVERMRLAKNFGRGIWVRHQMFYASVSLRCYGSDPTVDTNRLIQQLQDRYSLFRFVDGTFFQASFGHLDDYSALYYTYMWSLVIEKDLFRAWSSKGLLDHGLAARYRDTILRPGGSLDAVDLVRSFLGRDYEFAAFERWLNSGA